MNGGGFIWGLSLSLVGRNTYLKVGEEVKVCELLMLSVYFSTHRFSYGIRGHTNHESRGHPPKE